MEFRLTLSIHLKSKPWPVVRGKRLFGMLSSRCLPWYPIEVLPADATSAKDWERTVEVALPERVGALVTRRGRGRQGRLRRR